MSISHQRSLKIAITVLALFLTSGTALAQAPAPMPTTYKSIAEEIRAKDSSADRGIFFNHAETIGKDKFTVNAYELIFAGLTYAWSDDAQATVNFLLPLFDEMPTVILANTKFVLSRSAKSTIALQGEASVFQIDDSSEDGTDASISWGTVGVAAIADYYVSPRFILHGQFGINSFWGEATLETDNGNGDSFGAGLPLGDVGMMRLVSGFTFVASDLIKLNAEIVLPGAHADGEFQFAEAVMALYGIRFYGKTLAADIAFARPFGKDVETDGLIMGIPWLSIAARF